MVKINLNEFAQEEAFNGAIEILNKQKEKIQDYLLERSTIVPETDLRVFVKKYKVPEEIARIIFVMELEYSINNDLSANHFNYELARLEKVSLALPNIYSFLVRFSIEEGFWIKYLTVDLPKKLRLKISKLLSLDRSLFGKLQGSKEDSALYILERFFLTNTIIKPILYSWLKEHKEASWYDAVSRFLCSLNKKAMEKAPGLVSELCNRFFDNIAAIKGIILTLDSKGWAGKAISQFHLIEADLQACQRNPKEMSWRIASELVLEAAIIIAYGEQPLELLGDSPFYQNKGATNPPSETTPSNILERKREDMVQDKLTQVLLSFESIPQEKRTKIVDELIEDYYHSAFLQKHQKPSIFAKAFLQQLVELLQIKRTEAKRILKNFDSQLMYRLSPKGAKEFPSKTVDEKVLSLLKEMVIHIIENTISYNEILEKQQRENQPPMKEKKAPLEPLTKKTIKNIQDGSLGEKLKNLSKKDLWYLIRDLYLNELFNEEDELLASTHVLKKISLELGLLLTESEALLIITRRLEDKKISPQTLDKELLDKTLCKIIWEQLKEQLSYQ